MYILNEERKQLRAAVRDFVDKEVIPVARELEHSGTFPAQLVKRCGELGFTSEKHIEENNRFSAMSFCIILEELARGCPSLALALVPHYLVLDIMNAVSSEKLAALIESGYKLETLFAYSISEESGGSDALGIDTSAYCLVDEWILNGSKTWITNLGVANGYLVAARTAISGRSRNITLFYVDSTAPGLTICEREPMIGMASGPHGTIRMESCRVSNDCMIGEENMGYRLLKPTMHAGRLAVSAISVGIANRALELATKYATETGKYGRNLSSYQGISFMLAEMYAKISTARSALYHAASLYDRNESRIAAEVATVKLVSTEMACDVCRTARQIHGANGLSRNFEVEQCFRDAQAMTIAEGTSEICKNIISTVVTSQGFFDNPN